MQNNKNRRYATQGMLIVRVVCGAYLGYLAYQLIADRATSTIPAWAMIVFPALFIVAAAFLIIDSLVKYIKGEYEGGKACNAEEEGNQVTDETQVVDAKEADSNQEADKMA